MTASSPGRVSPASLESFALKVVDLATYVGVVVALVFATVGALELWRIGGLVFTKWVLFFVGSALAAYASLRMRPASPERRVASVSAGPNESTVGSVEVSFVQRVAAALPPARWTNLSVGERFSPNVKRFVAGVAMVAFAMAMEFVFGIGIGL